MRQNNFRKNWYIHAGFIAIILGIVIYNLPYFAEMREFGNVEKAYKSGNIHAIQSAAEKYARKYPNGKHIEEVMFMPVKANKSEGPIALLDAVDWYLDAHPKGIYAKECTAISDSIWNIEISKYEKEAEKHASKDGAKFFIEMLHYMRENKIRTIEVLAEPTLNVKEYSEYPEQMRTYMESYPTGDELKFPDDLITIKDKVTIEKATGWVTIIESALKKGFNEVLTPDFIVIKRISKEDLKSDRKFPLVKISYIVNNDEIYGMPNIWTWGHFMEDNLFVPVNYVLGIAVSFDASFSLPNTEIKYNIKGKGNSGVEDIQGEIDEGYTEMCIRSTQQFANKIIQEFGFKPVTDFPSMEELYREQFEQTNDSINKKNEPKQFD